MHAQGGTFSLFAGDHPALAPIASIALPSGPGWQPLGSALIGDAADNFQPALIPDAGDSGFSQAIGWEEPLSPDALAGAATGAPGAPTSPATKKSYAVIAAVAASGDDPPMPSKAALPEGFRRASSPTAGFPDSLPLPWPNTNLNDPPGQMMSPQQVSLYLPQMMADGPLRAVPHTADEASAEPSGGPSGGGGDTDAVPDFIGTVDNMKNILKMPYSQEAVTMAVYRVGRTIVMDAADMVSELERPFRAVKESPKRTARRSRAAAKEVPPMPLNPFSALAQEDEDEEDQAGHDADDDDVGVQPLLQDAAEAAAAQSSDDEPPGARPASAESDGSSSSLTSKFVNHTIATHRALDEKAQEAPMAAAGATEQGPLPYMPKRTRNVHRQLDDLHLLLRSDSVLLSGVGHPKVGLRMRDVATEGPMTTDGALDLWMDNMLSDVPESVICWHEKGVLKGYLMMRTEDIPAMSGYAFEPAKVKKDALSVLVSTKAIPTAT